MRHERPNPNRGLTLIEVLAAVVLLSIIAAGTLPLLRTIAAQSSANRGTANGGSTGRAVSIADVAAVADVVMSRPAQFISGGPVPGPAGATIDWDRAIALGRLPIATGVPRPPLVARTLLPSIPETARAWIVFEAGDHRVFRLRRGRFVDGGDAGEAGNGDERAAAVRGRRGEDLP